MTTAPQETDEAVRDRTVVVQVPKDSRLETLLCLAKFTHERFTAAKEAYDELKDNILADLQELYPDADIKTYEIPGCEMYPPVTYGYQEQDYLPTPKVRQAVPEFYDLFKAKKKFWKMGFGKAKG